MQDDKNLGKAMQGQNTFQELFRKHFPKDDFCDCGSCVGAYLDELSEMIERGDRCNVLPVAKKPAKTN